MSHPTKSTTLLYHPISRPEPIFPDGLKDVFLQLVYSLRMRVRFKCWTWLLYILSHIYSVTVSPPPHPHLKSQHSCVGEIVSFVSWNVPHSGWGWLLFSVATAAAKSLQSCPPLCDPIDGSPPGSPVPGIFQARVVEWGAIASFYWYLTLPLHPQYRGRFMGRIAWVDTCKTVLY